MKHRLASLPKLAVATAVLVCGFTLAAADTAATETAPPADAALVGPPSPEQVWRGFVATLKPDGPRKASFVEERWFPIRKVPVRLSGELRLDPAVGLSLHYLQPEERTVILDRDGVLVRKPGEKDRALPPGERGGAALQLVLAVLRFDTDEIAAGFAVRLRQDSEAWTIDLEPTAEAAARLVSRVTVAGRDRVPTLLVVRPVLGPRLEIHLGEPETVSAFTTEERALHFR